MSTTQITPEFREQLKQFCIELNAWIEEGCPLGNDIFHRDDGICWSFIRWMYFRCKKDLRMDECAARLFNGNRFPFGDSERFRREQIYHTLYQNPARLAWIKEHMK